MILIIYIILTGITIWSVWRMRTNLGTQENRQKFYDKYYAEKTALNVSPYMRKRECDILTNDKENDFVFKNIIIAILGGGAVGVILKITDICSYDFWHEHMSGESVQYLIENRFLLALCFYMICIIIFIKFIKIQNENGLRLLILKDLIEQDKKNKEN